MTDETESRVRSAAREVLAALPEVSGPVRVTDTVGPLTCVILVAVREVGRPLTRKQVLWALREQGTPHGPGTVAKALADLTVAGELVNRRPPPTCSGDERAPTSTGWGTPAVVTAELFSNFANSPVG
jgi:hypothetical protein